MEEDYLQVEGSVGLNCQQPHCLKIHPSELYMIYSIGSLIVIKAVDGSPDSYLQGHSAPVCCIAVSPKGHKIASGEAFERGSEERAALIVWDFDHLSILYRVRFHKQSILTLSFSCDEKFLLSIGGFEDNNTLVLWNMKEGKSEIF
jgi:WD40 repeat protein